MKVSDIVTDQEIENAWGNANFGKRHNRDVIKEALLSCASGYSTGSFSTAIMQELGLTTKKWELTKKGKEYLYYAFHQEDKQESLEDKMVAFGKHLKSDIPKLYGFALFAMVDESTDDKEDRILGIQQVGFGDNHCLIAVIENAITSLKDDFNIIVEFKIIKEAKVAEKQTLEA